MAAAAILKITKIAISPQRFTDLYEIWYCVCGNFKNLLWLLFVCHDIIYFLHNSEFQVPVAMCTF